METPTTSTPPEPAIDQAAVQALATQLRGNVLQPGDPGYDQARRVWNAMIDRHPALIVRCAGVADVMHGVRFAREHDLVLAVRGCGHNIAGLGACDGGLLLDLSPMRSVRIDPTSKTARVGPGASLGDFDHEAQAFGLATPLGINSTTGVAGLTLGGGFGWLSRAYGLTVDNLLSADVVTADGERVTASETENADLFWGIRGGGGNFGVVTSFEFRLHDVGPMVLCGPIVYAHDTPDHAMALLKHVRAFNAEAPEKLTCWAVLRQAPPLPFLPPAVHGTNVVILVPFYAGDMAEGERLLEPLRSFGTPLADAVGPHPYAAFQQAFDPLLTEGARNYWKSHNFAELSDAALAIAIDYAANLPSPQSEIVIPHLGGAVARVPATATAYPHRDAVYVMNVHTRWEDPSEDGVCMAWARALYEAMAPYALGGSYVNFISERTGGEYTAYGINYDRLLELKNKYDPTNLFRMNQNIEPRPALA